MTSTSTTTLRGSVSTVVTLTSHSDKCDVINDPPDVITAWILPFDRKGNLKGDIISEHDVI